jgi:hypothetical protein
MPRRWRIGLGVAAAVGAAAPGVAAAAPCTQPPGDPQPGFTALPDFNERKRR